MTIIPKNRYMLAYTIAVLLEEYLDSLDQDTEPSDIYRAIMDDVERPLFEMLMRHTHGNQSKAADWLGINKTALRTKMKRLGLLL